MRQDLFLFRDLRDLNYKIEKVHKLKGRINLDMQKLF